MAKIDWSSKDQETPSVIERAHKLYQRHNLALSRHLRIPGLLARYRQQIDLTAQRTVSLGVPAFCIACAKRDCVCCFRGVEQRYDEYLLLTNLLLGDPGDWADHTGPTCFYCGARGCCLKAKHSFCLNFYCADIKQGLGVAAMDVLHQQVGQELSSQWELERVLMPWLWAEEESRG